MLYRSAAPSRLMSFSANCHAVLLPVCPSEVGVCSAKDLYPSAPLSTCMSVKPDPPSFEMEYSAGTALVGGGGGTGTIVARNAAIKGIVCAMLRALSEAFATPVGLPVTASATLGLAK